MIWCCVHSHMHALPQPRAACMVFALLCSALLCSSMEHTFLM